MYGSNYLYIGLTGLTLACAGFAQTDPPQTANTFLPTALPSAGPIKFSGLVDGYYSLNFNHPDSGVNTLRNFDTRANYPAINMGIIGAEMAPAPVQRRSPIRWRGTTTRRPAPARSHSVTDGSA